MSKKARAALTGTDYRKPTDSCLAKVSDNEPIFVLRARDILAAIVVEQWASLAANVGVNSDKVAGAREIARLMRLYKGRKIPD